MRLLNFVFTKNICFIGAGDSCTKQTTYAVGNWLGQEGTAVTIVDTPGFGDSDLGKKN